MKMSRLESSIRIVLEFNKALNRHDVEGMMLLMSEDCTFESCHPAPAGTVYSGKEAASRFWRDFFRDSPQAHLEVEQIFGFGFRCVMRWRYDWADMGGKEESVRGVDLFQIRNGSICEQLSYVKG
jgi:limonene-1,2-epoxide hydrolase